MTDSGLPVMVGLAVGIAFIVLFAMILRPDNTLSDEELIVKYGKLAEISYFLDKYPDARVEVERLPNEPALSVSFSAEKRVAPASEFNTGINILIVSAYKDRLNHLTLSAHCGFSYGVAIGGSIDDINAIDTIDTLEERCFPASNDNAGIFEPDASGNELNDGIYQFDFKG